MKVYSKTDIGKVRDTNQDFYYVSEDIPDIQLCILADGMGGYTGGEIASKLATMSAKEYITENISKIELQDKSEIVELIKKAIEYANTVVYKKSRRDENLEIP